VQIPNSLVLEIWLKSYWKLKRSSFSIVLMETYSFNIQSFQSNFNLYKIIQNQPSDFQLFIVLFKILMHWKDFTPFKSFEKLSYYCYLKDNRKLEQKIPFKNWACKFCRKKSRLTVLLVIFHPFYVWILCHWWKGELIVFMRCAPVHICMYKSSQVISPLLLCTVGLCPEVIWERLRERASERESICGVHVSGEMWVATNYKRSI